MKKFNFKDFKYELIDSAKKGYKEVLVTYNADGTTARQYLFVKESKGKGNDYYTNAAKKIIDERIKSGQLAKSTAKQLKFKGVKTGGALKPIMITLSCVLAAGAIGTGGYFTYKYFTSPGGDVPPGPGPSPVVTGYTVTLLPGEGSFKDGKPYLTYGNVEKGTELKSLTGYSYPTTVDNKDFNFWTNDKGEQFVDTSMVESDLVLTASFIEGPGYYKAFTLNEIQEKIDDLKDAGIKENVTKPYEQILESVKQSFEKEGFIVDGNQAKALKEFADVTLDQILSIDFDSGSSVARKDVPQTFNDILNSIYDAKGGQISTLLNVAANCEKSMTKHLVYPETPTYFKSLFSNFAGYIKNDDGTLAHILEIVAPIVMEATSNIFNPNDFTISTLMSFLEEGVNVIHEYGNLTDDQIKELGTLIGNRVTAVANYSSQESIDNFYRSVLTSFDEALHAEEEKELKTANYKLLAEGMKALTNIGNPLDYKGDPNLTISIINHILDVFNDLYQKGTLTVDNIELATKFTLLAIDAASNISDIDSNTFKECFVNLIGSYLDTNNPYKDVDLKTVECLAKLPNVAIQSVIIKAGLSSSFVQYILTTRSEVISNIETAQGEIGVEIMKEVELGRLEAASYSPFFALVARDDSWMEDLKGAYEEALELCRDGNAQESDKYRGSLLSGFFIGFSKELQYHLLSCEVALAKQCFAEIPVKIVIDGVSSSSDDYKGVFSKYFVSIMSNLPSRFRSFACQGMQYTQYIGKELERFSQSFYYRPQELENFYKEYEKLYTSDYIFEYNDFSKPMVRVLNAVELMRLQSIISGKVFDILTSTTYPQKSRFDDIFYTFEEELYSKLSYNISDQILNPLIARVAQLVE